MRYPLPEVDSASAGGDGVAAGEPAEAPDEPAQPAGEPVPATDEPALAEQARQEPAPQEQEQEQETEKEKAGQETYDVPLPPAESPEESVAKPAAQRQGWLHGSLSARYRGRSGAGDHDHDASGVLALDVADPGTPWISGHVLARVDVDLEGLDGGEVFEDLSDTYDESVVPKLYLAYADVALDRRPEKSPGTLRIGRQSDPRLPEVLRMDGISYLSRPLGNKEIELGLYGGIPVHLYESSSEGDRSYGSFVEGRPWRDGRARVDWMHLEDEQVLGEGRDDLLTLGLWQRLARSWRFEGLYSHLEGDPRDLRLRGFYTSPDAETHVRAGYYALLETQTALVTELDPFFEQLLEYSPFRQTTLNVSQVLGERTTLDAGFDLRRVDDADDVGEFNRDWERYYATAAFSDLGTQGLGLSLTVDRWDDDDQDTSSLGADLSYDADESWKGAIGTYYSLYKYEFLELDERDDVRTYYVRASREVSTRLQLEVLYEFEDDDLDHYNTLRVGAVWRF